MPDNTSLRAHVYIDLTNTGSDPQEVEIIAGSASELLAAVNELLGYDSPAAPRAGSFGGPEQSA